MATDHDWTPERIKNLRNALGMNQAEFGQYLYAGYSAANAQTQVSRLENDHTTPGAAARATLNRLAQQAEQKHS